MENFLGVLITTFAVVFVAELGDKTQVASGIGALANRKSVRWIFAGSAVALTTVSLLTTVLAGLIPAGALPAIAFGAGLGLIIHGLVLAWKARHVYEHDIEEMEEKKNGWRLFLAQFVVVFLAEMGDKTQFFTAGAAIKNNANLLPVFLGSASALVSVTALTVWGASFVPKRFIRPVQIIGALGLVVYGIYMIIGAI